MRTTLTILLLFAFFAHAHGQLDTLWSDQYGGEYEQRFQAMDIYPNGDVIVGGMFQVTEGAVDNAWAARMNDSGEILWEYRFGQSENDYVTDILVLESGDALLLALHWEPVTQFLSSSVVSLDSQGNEVWTSIFSVPEGYLRLEALALGPDGTIGSAGSISDMYTEGNDQIILTMNQFGTQSWQQIVGGYAQQWASDLVYDPEDEVWACIGQTTDTLGGDSDLFFTRFDQTGAITDSVTFGDLQNDDVPSSIRLHANDGYMMTVSTDHGSGVSPTIIFTSPIGSLYMMATLQEYNGQALNCIPTSAGKFMVSGSALVEDQHKPLFWKMNTWGALDEPFAVTMEGVGWLNDVVEMPDTGYLGAGVTGESDHDGLLVRCGDGYYSPQDIQVSYDQETEVTHLDWTMIDTQSFMWVVVSRNGVELANRVDPFFDDDLSGQPDGVYEYRLRAQYWNENFSPWSRIHRITKGESSVGEDAAVLHPDFRLHELYPNPFNSTTTATISLPRNAEVRVRLYNTLGQRVDELVQVTLPAGEHRISIAPNSLASGVYYLEVQAGSWRAMKRAVFMK